MKRLIVLVLFLAVVTNGFCQKWKATGIGVGLIVVDENYDKKLRIAQKGDKWDIKELYENGALAGRYKGNQQFAAWIEGPHTSTYLNSNGVAIWLCKYVVYYPNGNRQEFGPYGFYTPGFNIMSVNPSGNNGKWKIEYYIWNRDTQDSFLIDTKEFYITD